jgi:hypothetical protein
VLAAYLPLAAWLGAILALPPLGAWLAGQPLDQYLRLPLATRAFDPLPFSAPVFWVSTSLAAVLILTVLWLTRPRRPLPPSPELDSGAKVRAAFPPWGWAGAIAIAVAGLLPALGLPVLLLGLTLLANALTQQRTGSCLLTRRPGFVAALLPAGMLLGWLYHWLNLFLQLWHYPDAASALPFALTCTLEYALLLPAVLSLRQWLASFPRLLGSTQRGMTIDGTIDGAVVGWALVAFAALGLVGAAVWPDWIYPLTWTAPLLLALGMAMIGGRLTPFAGIREGDWSRVLLPAGAALMLGGIVQIWGALMGAGWTLTLPLLDGARVLGLPALAYLGFLPLALLAIWLADQIARPWRNRPLKRFPDFPIKVVIKP